MLGRDKGRGLGMSREDKKDGETKGAKGGTEIIEDRVKGGEEDKSK